MNDGQSTGPASTPPVSPIESVVQPGDFPRELTDDQLQLQLQNNHIIEGLVTGFGSAMQSPLDTIENIKEAVHKTSEQNASSSPEQLRMQQYFSNERRDERYDIATTKRLINARNEIDRLSNTLEEDIQRQLQAVSNKFADMADILNAQAGRGKEIRSDIARLDSLAVVISEQLDQIRKKMEIFHVDLLPGDAAREGLAKSLDAIGMPPPSMSASGYETLYENWVIGLRDIRYTHPYQALLNAQGYLLGEYRKITVQYPSEYKLYQRLLGGYATEEAPYNWWNIVSTVGWFIAEEAAFYAASVVLIPITGGIGTALLVHARMLKRAGALGRLARNGIRQGINIARWLRNLDQRLWGPIDDIFQNALSKLRGRVIIHKGRPGSQVNGHGSKPRSPSCAGFSCV